MRRQKKYIPIDTAQRTTDFDTGLFASIQYAVTDRKTHHDIAYALQHSALYTITIIIDTLDTKYWNNKTYVKKTQRKISTKYVELLHRYFVEDFGTQQANEIYGQWLDKYRDMWNTGGKIQYQSIDEYIEQKELGPRYLPKIQKRFKNIGRLKQPRFIIDRDRYYNVPEPFNHIDWRNPFDTIFVWKETNQRYARRGGSGGSSQRETNSKYIYAFGLINQQKPIPSHLFYYSPKNTLEYIHSFDSLTIPSFDIGSNYHISLEEQDTALRGTHLLHWDIWNPLSTLTSTTL